MNTAFAAYIRSWIACITALSIASVLIEYLLPHSSIRRYVQYGTGLLVLQQMLEPVRLLLNWLLRS